LGVCYKKGHVVQKNLPEAFKWFKLAAEQGHSNAQQQLTSLLPLLSATESTDEPKGLD
jgi:TPR repeat protein